MSEYQYYEFLALDRPLTDKQRAELRSISTRAEITATRFVNEYQWGDLKGDRCPGHRATRSRSTRARAAGLQVACWYEVGAETPCAGFHKLAAAGSLTG